MLTQCFYAEECLSMQPEVNNQGQSHTEKLQFPNELQRSLKKQRINDVIFSDENQITDKGNYVLL